MLAQAVPFLSVSPVPGAIQGPPGGTTGWGFTITNPDPNYLVVTGAQFCTTATVAGFTVCDQFPDPALGTFTDFIGQYNFIVAGPGSPAVSQTFNSLARTGLGSFTFAPGAILNSTFSGQLLVSYDLYSRSPADPLFDPGTDFIAPGADGNTLTAAATVTATPEPATWFLMACGVAVLVRRGRR